MTSIAKPSAVETLAVGAVFIPVSVLVVGLRFAAKRCQRSNLHIDDWLMIPSLVSA